MPSARSIAARVRRADPDRILVALGIAVVVLSVPALLARGDELEAPLASALAAVAGGVAVAYARRRPVAAILGFSLALIVAVLLGSAIEQQNDALVAPFFVLPIAWAANTDRRTFLLTLPLVVLLLPAADLIYDPGATENSLTFILIVPIGLGSLGGRLMHWHGEAQTRLREQARELAANRDALAAAAVTAERQRIARELHDLIAHEVSVMVVQAQAAERQVQAGRPGAAAAIESVETTGREALTEMRRLLGVLRQGDEDLALRPQPSLRRIDVVMAEMRERGVELRLAVEGPPVDLPSGVDVAAFRILSAGLRSVVDDGGARWATAVVRRSPQELGLELEADGVISAAAYAGIRERTELYGGSLEREAHTEDSGGRMRIRLPLAPDGVLA